MLKPGLIRSMLLLMGGNAIGQIVIALSSLVLSRLYTPTDFGLLASFSALVSLFLVVSSVRFELAIPLSRDEEVAVSLLMICLLLLVFTSLGASLGAWLYSPTFFDSLKGVPFALIAIATPLALFGAGLYQILSYWAIRKKAFDALARTRITQGVAMASVQLLGGFLSLGPIGLIAGDIAGRFSGSGLLSRRLGILRLGVRRLPPITKAGKEYWRFALIMSLAAMLNMLGLQLPLLVLPKYFGGGIVGSYFFSTRVLSFPLGLLVAAGSQVFFAEAAQLVGKPEIANATRSVTTFMFAFGLPIYLGLVVIGPTAFEFVFGPQWNLAGEFARWLAPGLVLRLVATTLGSLLMVGRKYRDAVLITGMEFLAMTFSLCTGILTGSVLVFVVLSSATGVLVALLSIWRYSKVCQLDVVELLWSGVRPIVFLNVLAVALLIVALLFSPPWFSVLLWVLSVTSLLFASLNRFRVGNSDKVG